MFAAPVYIVNGPEPAECLQRSCEPPRREARTAHCFYACVRNRFASPPSVSPSLPYTANGVTGGAGDRVKREHVGLVEIQSIAGTSARRGRKIVGRRARTVDCQLSAPACGRIPGRTTVALGRNPVKTSFVAGIRVVADSVGYCERPPQAASARFVAAQRHPPSRRAGVEEGLYPVLP